MEGELGAGRGGEAREAGAGAGAGPGGGGGGGLIFHNYLGGAVQVEPMKPVLKAHDTTGKRLKT
jgi:hypothetical protein